MRTTTVLSFCALVTCALAHPLLRRANSTSDIDVTILQFALTLEHLENVFYKEAINRFSASDFAKAGLDQTYYQNLNYVANDEQSHVVLLETALKAANQTPTAACTYDFPYTDVPGFITLSSVLEGVGTSAYLGGASLITSKDYLTVAGSILVTEALHTSLQRVAAGEIAAANPNGTPLDPTSVYTLAASFIVYCPPSNPALPFTPFPELVSYVPLGTNYTSPVAGAQVSFTTKETVPAGAFVTFVAGLSVISVPAQTNGGVVTAQVPAEAQGQTYAFISKANITGTLVESQIVAGPAVVEVTPPAPSLSNTIL